MCIWRLAQMQISLWGLSTTQMVAPSYCTCTGAGTGTGTGTGTGYRFRPVFHLRQTRPPSIHPSIVPVPVQILYQQGAERGVNVYNCVRSTLCT